MNQRAYSFPVSRSGDARGLLCEVGKTGVLGGGRLWVAPAFFALKEVADEDESVSRSYRMGADWLDGGEQPGAAASGHKVDGPLRARTRNGPGRRTGE